MGRMQKNLRYIGRLFAALTVVSLLMTASVYARPESKTIKVAFPLQAGLTELDENGEYSGYTYEYLQEVAQYTGWRYEFVQVSGTLNEQLITLMGMVKNGEVDLIGGTLYSEELAKEYDIGSYSYATVETVLQTLNRKSQNVVIDASRQQTLRIACHTTSGRLVSDLEEFCRMNLITPVLVECRDEAEAMEAIEDGRADAYLNTSMNYLNNMRTIASFSPRQVYFITSKNDTSRVLTELNAAMSRINQSDPQFQVALYEKYFSPESGELHLSETEKAYIETTGPLKAGILVNRPPFQYRESTDNRLKGIGVDLLRYISEKTGLAFEMVEVETEERLYELVSSGQLDLVAGMPYNYTIAQKERLSMTRPYVTGQYTLLLNEGISKDELQDKRLALPNSSSYREYLNRNVTYYPSVDACIRAVAEGAADYTYMDAYAAQYYINIPEFESLKMMPQTTYQPYKSSFAISTSADRTLLDILNKTILAAPEEELQRIIYANVVPRQPFTVQYFIRRNPMLVISAIACVFLLILAALLAFLYQRSRASRAVAFELQKHQRLYALSNDMIFEYDYKKKSMMISMPGAEGKQAKIYYHDASQVLENPEAQKSQEILLELLDGRKDCVCEVQLYGTDQCWHWYRIFLETISDESGRPLYALGKFNLIDKEKTEKEELLEKAQRDSLTHLFNNESFREMTVERLAFLEEGRTGALVLLDIDSFKAINDTYGHMRGDQILCEVAGLLEKHFRGEIVGRPGGDEFAVYLPDISREKLGEKCWALCCDVRRIRLEAGKHLTVSLGGAMSLCGLEYEILYKTADQAMYEAKNAGRDLFKIAPINDAGKENMNVI